MHVHPLHSGGHWLSLGSSHTELLVLDLLSPTSAFALLFPTPAWLGQFPQLTLTNPFVLNSAFRLGQTIVNFFFSLFFGEFFPNSAGDFILPPTLTASELLLHLVSFLPLSPGRLNILCSRDQLIIAVVHIVSPFTP